MAMGLPNLSYTKTTLTSQQAQSMAFNPIISVIASSPSSQIPSSVTAPINQSPSLTAQEAPPPSMSDFMPSIPLSFGSSQSQLPGGLAELNSSKQASAGFDLAGIKQYLPYIVIAGVALYLFMK